MGKSFFLRVSFIIFILILLLLIIFDLNKNNNELIMIINNKVKTVTIKDTLKKKLLFI